ncbi:MAG: flagellar hook-length control protein FliK [Verrucomicrobia bacterium]|nr:flagellar hook-length control protein FliK [Verrucomicrobiota bacterium]
MTPLQTDAAPSEVAAQAREAIGEERAVPGNAEAVPPPKSEVNSETATDAEADSAEIESDQPRTPAPEHAEASERNSGEHKADPSRSVGNELAHGARTDTARDVVLADNTSLPDAPRVANVSASALTPSTDGVTGLESVSDGGKGSAGDGLLDARSSGSGGNSAGTADAGVAERLESVFQQVLQTASAPADLRERIELARSIGRQVIQSALVSVKNGQTRVTLQLRPPSLGAVRMELVTEGRTVSARLAVESEQVRHAVEQHVSQLRSVLRNEGFNLDRFEVSVRSQTDPESWASKHPDSHGQQRDRAAAGAHDDARTGRDAVSTPEASARAVSTHNGRIDTIA